MVISCGDVFWLTLRGQGSEPDGRRPVVVVQQDRFNRTALATAVVAAVTTNLRLAAMPGDVILGKGEAGLPKPCVVNVTQLQTVDKSRLAERAGRLGERKRAEVEAGLALVLGSGLAR